MQDALIFAGMIFAVLLVLILSVIKPSGIHGWWHKDGKGSIASAALAIVVVVAGGLALMLLTGQRVQAQSVLDNKYGHFFNHAYTFAGVDYARKVSPQCVPDSTADHLTSNMGFGLNAWQSPSRRVHLDLVYTHHSCVFGHDRNSYDGMGVRVTWFPWVRGGSFPFR